MTSCGKPGTCSFKSFVIDFLSSHRFNWDRYTALNASHLKIIGNEVKTAIAGSKYGIGPNKRFLSYSRSEILEFCRGVASSASLRELHLGRRISPAYWVIERAAIIYLNNALKATRAKEKKDQAIHASNGADAGTSESPAVQCTAERNGAGAEAMPTGPRGPAPVDAGKKKQMRKRKANALSDDEDDNDDGRNESGMLPLDSVERFEYDKCQPGTSFGFLSPEEARLSGALSQNADCSSPQGMDALCSVRPMPNTNEILGVRKPSEDFVAVSVIKMNDSFGRRVTVPWESLYSDAPRVKVSHLVQSEWILRPGLILWWKAEHVWTLDKNLGLNPFSNRVNGSKKRRL